MQSGKPVEPLRANPRRTSCLWTLQSGGVLAAVFVLGNLRVGSRSDSLASGCQAKTVHHFYFNKDPPGFINATDAGAMAFQNECPSVRSAGASLLRQSAKKGACAARALATGAKVKTTAVRDE